MHEPALSAQQSHLKESGKAGTTPADEHGLHLHDCFLFSGSGALGMRLSRALYKRHVS